MQQQQSSIYTEFKLETQKFIDENFDLATLLESYSKVCSEHSHLLKEKLQYLNVNRQK